MVDQLDRTDANSITRSQGCLVGQFPRRHPLADQPGSIAGRKIANPVSTATLLDGGMIPGNAWLKNSQGTVGSSADDEDPACRERVAIFVLVGDL
jgi:hypothetical protein